MLRINAGHGGAHAYSRRHELHYFTFWLELLCDAADQIQLRTDQPAGSRLCIANGVDDVFRRADIIRIFSYLKTAFGV